MPNRPLKTELFSSKSLDLTKIGKVRPKNTHNLQAHVWTAVNQIDYNSQCKSTAITAYEASKIMVFNGETCVLSTAATCEGQSREQKGKLKVQAN